MNLYTVAVDNPLMMGTMAKFTQTMNSDEITMRDTKVIMVKVVAENVEQAVQSALLHIQDCIQVSVWPALVKVVTREIAVDVVQKTLQQ